MSQRAYRLAMKKLAARDKRIAAALALCGAPPERRTEAGFAGLLRSIIAQQVSSHAARAIWSRLADCCAPLTPESLLALDEASIRAAGLSRSKVLYARGLAEACASGMLDFAALARMRDEEAIAALVRLKGIGRWTAEVYLLLALDRRDVFPADDLALQVAGGRLLGLRSRPTGSKLRGLAEDWAPWRGVMARFLWHYYRHPGVA
ncbi:MAG: DNA-3-methyladenine glycosylase 2 family protein [Alphaproteobacteria bacterium]|nr:DNA-3-methyladenine glycosylase 2 family protein [Alphaproteobacteria bacterium]